ncbi:hypothetical protein [Adlercreutzia sp. ZJ138]|uniref:hypothetical protein n=1 Tax=Adlercreutzia sp. ZJ138 TaxID=2709405 RepID=UPI0013EBB26A|nr:hypothetical protein [Adlercreutzia sp. ZJ138]
MEKNRSLRTASGLFVLVLLTICVVGATYAKYVTSDTATDTARVAKWGVDVSVSNTDPIFKSTYMKAATSTTLTAGNSVEANAAVDGSRSKVVAPGTSGTLINASITGTPEVAVKVKTEASLDLSDWTIDGNTEYCPIVITIDSVPYKMGDSTNETNHVYASIEEFETAVKTALNEAETDSSNQFAPNTPLSDKYDHLVTWNWAFAGDGNPFQTDDKDTKLGNLTTAPTIAFTYTATVTQID